MRLRGLKRLALAGLISIVGGCSSHDIADDPVPANHISNVKIDLGTKMGIRFDYYFEEGIKKESIDEIIKKREEITLALSEKEKELAENHLVEPKTDESKAIDRLIDRLLDINPKKEIAEELRKVLNEIDEKRYEIETLSNKLTEAEDRLAAKGRFLIEEIVLSSDKYKFIVDDFRRRQMKYNTYSFLKTSAKKIKFAGWYDVADEWYSTPLVTVEDIGGGFTQTTTTDENEGEEAYGGAISDTILNDKLKISLDMSNETEITTNRTETEVTGFAPVIVTTTDELKELRINPSVIYRSSSNAGFKTSAKYSNWKEDITVDVDGSPTTYKINASLVSPELDMVWRLNDKLLLKTNLGYTILIDSTEYELEPNQQYRAGVELINETGKAVNFLGINYDYSDISFEFFTSPTSRIGREIVLDKILESGLYEDYRTLPDKIKSGLEERALTNNLVILGDTIESGGGLLLSYKHNVDSKRNTLGVRALFFGNKTAGYVGYTGDTAGDIYFNGAVAGIYYPFQKGSKLNFEVKYSEYNPLKPDEKDYGDNFWSMGFGNVFIF